MRKMSVHLLLLVVVVATVLTACGNDAEPSTEAIDATTDETTTTRTKSPFCDVVVEAQAIQDDSPLEAIQMQAKEAPTQLIDDYAKLESLVAMTLAGAGENELQAAVRLTERPMANIVTYLHDECGITVDVFTGQ